MKTPSTDKFSRRLVCRIVNYTQSGVQKHHSDADIIFFPSHNKRFCFAMNNAASVALFGHIALDRTPQRLAPEMLQSLWKPFGGYREEKEGILSMFRVTISIHPLMEVLVMCMSSTLTL